MDAPPGPASLIGVRTTGGFTSGLLPSTVRRALPTILVVDDEPDILQGLQAVLEGSIEGVRVLTAENGPAALRILAELGSRPDLVITDYRMPTMDGLEFLARAGKAIPGVPRILITAYADVEIAVRAINEADVEYFLRKPFRGEDLLEAVKAALFRRRFDDAWRRTLTGTLKKPPA